MILRGGWAWLWFARHRVQVLDVMCTYFRYGPGALVDVAANPVGFDTLRVRSRALYDRLPRELLLDAICQRDALIQQYRQRGYREHALDHRRSQREAQRGSCNQATDAAAAFQVHRLGIL